MYDYSAYTIEELARDDYFRHAILNPDRESAAFWQSWAAASPDQHDRYEKARMIVIALEQRYHTQLSQEEVAHRVGQLVGRLDEPEDAPRPAKPAFLHYWWRAAAVLVAALGFALWSYRHDWKPLRSGEHGAQAASRTLSRNNNTPHIQTLMLSDSSIVTLFPGSALQFPETFSGDSRKVTLTGDAFFEVAHDGKPFLVYAGETVTRVWGTRFRVTALPGDKQVKVSVKSGKVSVHRVEEFNLPKTTDTQPIPGVMLTMHEQVVFDRTNHLLEKAHLTDLGVVAQGTDLREQVFVDAPVTEVFKELESIYGIEIRFDERLLGECRIITSFRGETLVERINSICQAIGAHYEPTMGSIVISGDGCGI